jgi:hypothetical protein
MVDCAAGAVVRACQTSVPYGIKVWALSPTQIRKENLLPMVQIPATYVNEIGTLLMCARAQKRSANGADSVHVRERNGHPCSAHPGAKRSADSARARLLFFLRHAMNGVRDLRVDRGAVRREQFHFDQHLHDRFQVGDVQSD